MVMVEFFSQLSCTLLASYRSVHMYDALFVKTNVGFIYYFHNFMSHFPVHCILEETTSSHRFCSTSLFVQVQTPHIIHSG